MRCCLASLASIKCIERFLLGNSWSTVTEIRGPVRDQSLKLSNFNTWKFGGFSK